MRTNLLNKKPNRQSECMSKRHMIS